MKRSLTLRALMALRACVFRCPDALERDRKKDLRVVIVRVKLPAKFPITDPLYGGPAFSMQVGISRCSAGSCHKLEASNKRRRAGRIYDQISTWYGGLEIQTIMNFAADFTTPDPDVVCFDVVGCGENILFMFLAKCSCQLVESHLCSPNSFCNQSATLSPSVWTAKAVGDYFLDRIIAKSRSICAVNPTPPLGWMDKGNTAWNKADRRLKGTIQNLIAKWR